MERDNTERSLKDGSFALPDPTMDAALNWFALLQGDPDDDRLKAQFEIWRSADQANAKAFAEVARVWDLPELDIVADGLVGDVGRRQTATNVVDIAPVRSRQSQRGWAYAAMAAAATILVAVGVTQYPALMLQVRSDYQTEAGAREEITLPDGSRLVLNTASAVSLDFEGTRRAVTLLRGEAYFDVVPDASRPFTVTAAFSEVVVKGTAFTVRTDPGSDTVVLERGLVDVTRLAAETDRAALQPGQAITATAASLSAVRDADIATALAWREGRLIFENQPFEEVVREIGRYYGHTIVVASDEIGQSRVTGNYLLEAPERTIRSLAATVGGSVTRLPGGVLILH